MFFRAFALAILCALVSIAPGTAATKPSYYWRNVTIGGGGYITGMVIHPSEPELIYARTDVGGFYRWDAPANRWIPITDHFTLEEQELYGGESIAIDPQDPNVVYIACGRSLAFGMPNGVFKSTNRGVTWTRLPLNNVEMHGNGMKRNTGERLVVSPHDSNLLLFGTRGDGLLRSTNGGLNWTKLTSFPDVWTWGTGFTSVEFDPTTPGTVYAAAYGSDADDGVRRSLDNCETWTLLAGGPANVNRMAVATNGVLFVSHQAGVSKYAVGAWSHYIPGGTAVAFNGLSVNRINSDEVIVAEGEANASKIYRTLNGGTNWTLISPSRVNTVPWLDSFRIGNPRVAPLVFDPSVPGRVWLGDWYGIWRTDNISAATPVFTNFVQGMEECVVFALAAPEGGPLLLSGVADNDGFRHDTDLRSTPTKRLGISGLSTPQETYGFAIFRGNAQHMVRACGGRNGPFHVTVSTDGGLNWTNTSWQAAVPGTRAMRIAVSASDSNNIVAVTDRSLVSVSVPDAGVPRCTFNGGASWQFVSGLPDGPSGPFYNGQPLASDPGLGGVFYYHDGPSGKLFRSLDGGLNFSLENADSLLPTTTASIALKARSDVAGELWTCLDTLGLHRSVNGGVSFTAVPNVTRAYRIAFGKAPPGSSIPALYLCGKVNGHSGWLFRSLDLGDTWTEIFDPAVAIGNTPAGMEASAQHFGVVFVGTAGRGVFYGEPIPTLSISQQTNHAIIQWPPNVGGFQLQKRTSLDSSWESAPDVEFQNNQWRAIRPLDSQSEFYRLNAP